MASSITVDGWSGSGKTTLSQALSGILQLPAVHTGMLYRAVTAEALAFSAVIKREGLRIVAARVAAQVDLVAACVTRPQRTRRNLDRLWTDRVTSTVSHVAQDPAVREVITRLVRSFVAREGPSIVEGRDVATVILPEACLKIFLDCEAEDRWTRSKDQSGRSRDARDAPFLRALCKPVTGSLLVNTAESDPRDLAVVIAAEYKKRIVH